MDKDTMGRNIGLVQRIQDERDRLQELVSDLWFAARDYLLENSGDYYDLKERVEVATRNRR